MYRGVVVAENPLTFPSLSQNTHTHSFWPVGEITSFLLERVVVTPATTSKRTDGGAGHGCKSPWAELGLYSIPNFFAGLLGKRFDFIH
jgi:hypothetical protein